MIPGDRLVSASKRRFHAVLAASSRRAGRSLVLLVIVLLRKAAEGLFACSVARERSNGWVCVSCLMLLDLLSSKSRKHRFCCRLNSL